MKKEEALSILDEMDEFRRKPENAHGRGLEDNRIRICEAIVAGAAGFTERTEWTELLRADKSSKYYAFYRQDATREIL